MLQSGILHYQKFQKDTEEYGFKVNPCDPCEANKIVNGRQLTITWHVDDLKASHVYEEELDQFVEWLKTKYGLDVNKLKVHKGKIHDYLAMNLNYIVKGQARINMIKCVKDMIKDFAEHMNKAHATPASKKLFSIHQILWNWTPKEKILFIIWWQGPHLWPKKQGRIYNRLLCSYAQEFKSQ